MLRIEFEPPTQSVCECCGGTTTRLTRFVYEDDGAFAVYYAAFSDRHPDRTVKMLVSLGEWGEGSTPDQRRAFALHLRVSQANYEVTVTDAEASPWRGKAIIGRVLDRAEALQDPWLPDVFHITDHAVMEDAPLKE